jgi:hypothetical protein
LTGSNIFFGVVSDTSITKIRWEEALEANGGNEETGLDNFYVVRGVPEPCSSALCGFAALATLLFRRRR